MHFTTILRFLTSPPTRITAASASSTPPRRRSTGASTLVCTVVVRDPGPPAWRTLQIAAAFAALRLYPAALEAHARSIVALITLELTRYVVDWVKFRRVASYHMWSSKLWGLLLFIALFALLVFGRAGWTLSIAIYAGIVADVEGLALSWVLSESRTDVASIVHALRPSSRKGAGTPLYPTA